MNRSQTTEAASGAWATLCAYIHKELGAGVVYRVKSIRVGPESWGRDEFKKAMNLEPTFGFLQDISGRRCREVFLNYINNYETTLEPIDLVRLSNEHFKLVELIKAYAKELSGDLKEKEQ